MNKPVQVPLDLPVDEAAVLAKALELFVRSPTLRRRYGCVEKALEDPVAGRCLRLSATQLLRSRARGR